MDFAKNNYFFYTNTMMHRAVYWSFLVSSFVLSVMIWVIYVNPSTNHNVLLVFVGILSSYVASCFFYYLNNVIREKMLDRNRVAYIAEIYMYYRSAKELLDINWEESHRAANYFLKEIHIYRKTGERDGVIEANVALSSIEFLKAAIEQVSISLSRDVIRQSGYVYDNLIAVGQQLSDLKAAMNKFYEDSINKNLAEIKYTKGANLNNPKSVARLQFLMCSPVVDDRYKRLNRQIEIFLNGFKDKRMLMIELEKVIKSREASVRAMSEKLWFPCSMYRW